VEKIKVDTLFISNAENGVRVRTTEVTAADTFTISPPEPEQPAHMREEAQVKTP
jgi:hypothetical protein